MRLQSISIATWIPALTMMLVSLISYIDRSTLAVLSPTILKDTHLSTESYGYIVAAFNVAYMLGNPLWGRFLDRFGLRAGMFAAVGFWTLASAAHMFAAGFWSFDSAGGARLWRRCHVPRWSAHFHANAACG